MPPPLLFDLSKIDLTKEHKPEMFSKTSRQSNLDNQSVQSIQPEEKSEEQLQIKR